MATTPETAARRYGAALLENPLTNKGTAFSATERRELGLDGLLPPVIESLDQQAARAYEAYRGYDANLAKHVYLRALQDTNEVLFYNLLIEHVEELLPIVYTPTVGLACQRFSKIYRRSRGLFLSYPHRERLAELLRNRPNRAVDVIVVTDGQRILGLGDQGAGGLGIPIGKLSLYTAIGGIHPARTLPIVLDVGTNNEERLGDPEYIGWRHERIGDDDYDDYVERFVRAVEQELPGTLLQWEDFATPHARPILDRYRDRLLTFNDDIQGTAAVATGAITGAVRAAGSRMRDQRIVMLGAGSAGIGVADMLRVQMATDGVFDAEARRRFYVVDVNGLLTEHRTDLTPEQRVYAQPAETIAGWTRTGTRAPDLADVIANVDATILIGLSTATGAFSEPIIREMARKVRRPIIFPLSNPTSRSEADPADLARWTEGRVLVATGSPYPPLKIDGTEVPVAQCNNVFIFPAVGLGIVTSRATRVTDGMLQAAAGALGELSPALTAERASLLPPIGGLRGAAVHIATAVAVTAVREGVAPHAGADELRARVAATQWVPRYEN
ncbi:NAD-dependent malic enzyme [Sphaerisporangium perillae]|uniref:NAD-dependent malic enzyme n=1 Tax=Sphaerisporangium perillae TaxID=2935860 RepID=UPI00200CB674|nr:NAD-dependent malic enzyme [Sphaerisporangium perillae]